MTIRNRCGVLIPFFRMNLQCILLIQSIDMWNNSQKLEKNLRLFCNSTSLPICLIFILIFSHKFCTIVFVQLQVPCVAIQIDLIMKFSLMNHQILTEILFHFIFNFVCKKLIEVDEKIANLVFSKSKMFFDFPVSLGTAREKQTCSLVKKNFPYLWRS